MSRHLASLTADIVVLNDKNEILVIKRKNPPFQNQWALPGGFVEEGETFVQAAQRELMEETGLEVYLGHFIKAGIWDAPNRDPRGRVVSQAFLVQMWHTPTVTPGDDATEFMWWPRNKRGLAFDHDHVVYWTLHSKGI